jgi:hypothetical protein
MDFIQDLSDVHNLVVLEILATVTVKSVLSS